MQRRAGQALGYTTMFLVLTCSGLDDFDVEQSASTTIQGAGIAGQILSIAPDFAGFSSLDISQTSEFENQGVTKDDIDAVYVKSFTLRLTAPPGGDFTFLHTIAFYAEAEGVERKLIASGGDFPAGVTEVELDVEDVNLKAYAVERAMAITTEATGEAPIEDTEIEAHIVLSVDVNVGGVVCGG